MEELNHQWFLLINAGAKPISWLIPIARALAEWPIFMAIGLVLFAVLMRKRQRGRVVLSIMMTVSLSMAITYLIRFVWHHDRPFVIGLGSTWMHHDPTSSFPSFHATFMFAMAMSLVLIRGLRSFGFATFCMGCVVAWARVYLGVHFPFDMIGAFVVVFGVSMLIRYVVLKRFF